MKSNDFDISPVFSELMIKPLYPSSGNIIADFAVRVQTALHKA